MTTNQANIISLKDVYFAYPEQVDKPVLDIPSWAIDAGEQVFIHGPSGCGKSTLLNLLAGMVVSTEGQVNILDKNLREMSPRHRDQFRANHIGYVFQQFNLVPYLNAVENVRLAQGFCDTSKKTDARDIQELLESLNISSDDLRKPTAKLSMGQQQRVAIARALINKPEILIADEPTSSLDQANRDDFMSLLMEQVQEHKMTLVFVSHDISIAKHLNRIEALEAINRAAPKGIEGAA